VLLAHLKGERSDLANASWSAFGHGWRSPGRRLSRIEPGAKPRAARHQNRNVFELLIDAERACSLG
jgi:hypothetical protein